MTATASSTTPQAGTSLTPRAGFTRYAARQVDAESHGPHANAADPGDADGYRFEVWTWCQQRRWADPHVQEVARSQRASPWPERHW